MPQKIGNWYFKVRPVRDDPGNWLAWCARTPNLGNGPLKIDPWEETHFEFGETADAAMAKLKAEVLN